MRNLLSFRRLSIRLWQESFEARIPGIQGPLLTKSLHVSRVSEVHPWPGVSFGENRLVDVNLLRNRK